MANDNKKPNSDFVVRLVGPRIKPWRVHVRTLARLISAVQRLVEQRDDLVDVEDADEVDNNLGAEVSTLQLLSVKTQSAGYAMAARNRQATLAIIKETGESVENPDKAKWRPSTISSLDDLSQIAKQLGCIVEFSESKPGIKHGPVLAVIRPTTFAAVQSRAFVVAHTSVYGMLERIGGASAMKCGIHVQGRNKMLYCQVVGTDLIRELGKHIYTEVVLSGQATSYTFNKQIKTLRVTSFSPAKTDPIEDIAQRIRLAGGSAWDKIKDPDAYIRKMRG